MRGSFYGWYMKCQSGTQTLAVIPAVHLSRAKSTCSIQIISDREVRTATFPVEAFCKEGENIYIDKNCFGANGIELSIHTSELVAEGTLSFGVLSPLKYNIMGPFALMPFMECRHSVWSMCHSVCGRIQLNGKIYDFQNTQGYWEGDCGRSFPRHYAWTQCFFPGGSLMLSVAEIPVTGIHSIRGKNFTFTGIIGVVLWQGKEYRLATYLGAKVVENGRRKLKIVQRGMELEAQLLEFSGHPLKAPKRGDMVRIIHESASCRAFYRFRINGEVLLEFETTQASFEYEYPL